MIEAEPLTMFLDMCKRLSPAFEIRVCAHEVDKRSFILFSSVLSVVLGVQYLPASLEIGRINVVQIMKSLKEVRVC
jgi:hypothetical protein